MPTIFYGESGRCQLSRASASSRIRREELIRGKFDPAEQVTGVLRIGDAFLIRDTEVIGGNQHLYVAHNLHDHKDPQRDQNAAALRAGVQFFAEMAADALGDPAAGFTARKGLVGQACGKGDGLGDLHGCLGQVP